jgi:cytochrome c oxidase subunit 1
VNNVSVFQGSSSVMMTSYVPMMAHWSFYLGLILFAVGALIACFVFFGTLVVAKREKTYQGSVPLVTFGAITAAIIAVFTISSGAIILIPTFLMSIGLINEVDPLIYRTIWWAFGHSSQQINVAAHISIWYAVAAIAFGAKPMSERVSRGAFLLYILFPATRQCPPPACRPRHQYRVESGEHQLLHVLCCAGIHDPRPVHPWRHGSGPACARLQQGSV